ncbi:SCO2521 family protein [Streptomyces sp. NPDC059373]
MTGQEPGGSLIVVGEVRTGLVLNSHSMRTASVEALLDIVPGQRVRSYRRPVQRSVSADLLHGVDCPVFTGSGARTRGIGTLAARACVVGGRVLQGSTRAVLARGGERRLAWAHYLERPGVIEVSGRGRDGDLPTRFLAGGGPGALDPGAVSEWLTGRVQNSALLDHRPAFRARRSRLRWSACLAGDRFEGAFTLVDDELRTLRLSVPPHLHADPEELTALCEDLALHDWLLGTVASVADRACTGSGSGAALRRLRPAIDHLVHLWMPGAAVASGLLDAWDLLESCPGLTRQWDACVNRIRDHMALRALEMMAEPPGQADD